MRRVLLAIVFFSTPGCSWDWDAVYQEPMGDAGFDPGTYDRNFVVAVDSTLHENTPDESGGDKVSLTVSARDTMLMRFDVSAIPAGATVNSADLVVWAEARGGAHTVHALRVPFNVSQATWGRAAAGSPWEVPGASGDADRFNEELGTFSPDGFDEEYVMPFNESGIETVQGWVDDSSANLGLAILFANGEPVTVAARENEMAERRPTMAVNFTVD